MNYLTSPYRHRWKSAYIDQKPLPPRDHEGTRRWILLKDQWYSPIPIDLYVQFENLNRRRTAYELHLRR